MYSRNLHILDMKKITNYSNDRHRIYFDFDNSHNDTDELRIGVIILKQKYPG